ncbi:MAG: RdgB/HAM1 family non-canonical purine NTP pyrophosphatase [Acidimicrobiia bacterium]|nr:RdgB/HAM1 family non-canonical purine NTP pyrophosphatase [Acidimicrobiia bacterium]
MPPECRDPLRVVLATANPDKARELAAVLSATATGRAVELVGRPAGVPEVEETGTTLRENALLKARVLGAATDLPALADDTGLEVDALDGEPGVRSARYAGENATYADNVERLLREMAGVAPPDRGARFTTVVVLVFPSGEALEGVGVVEGRITEAPRGAAGFGYDPVFAPSADPAGRTFAEMDAAEKDRLSHRGAALRDLAAKLRDAVGTTGEEG